MDIFTVTEFVHKHTLAVESLTDLQLAEAIRQALVAGDFQRNVLIEDSTHKQSVLYLPYREVSRLKPLYDELIYAVASKHEGETRHETALRYIRERETPVSGKPVAKVNS